MSSAMQTKLDRGTVSDATRAKAVAVIMEEPDSEFLLEVLGLSPAAPAMPEAVEAPEEKPAVVSSKRAPGSKCPHCSNKVPRSGVCRRGKACREAADPKRPGSQAVAVELSCDRPGCTTTVIGRSDAGVRVNAELDGWLVGDKDGDFCGPHRPDGAGGEP